MQKVIILKGLPASGKSTWVKELQDSNPGRYKRINKDDLRSMVDNNYYGKNSEKIIIQLRDDMIWNFLKLGYHVIVDDTNLNPIHIDSIKEIVQGYNEFHNSDISIEIKMFDIGVDVAIERDSKRAKPVGAKVIKDMARKWLRIKEETPQPDLSRKLPICIICDIDNTLSIMGDRSPYDASKCDELDTINVATKTMLDNLCDNCNYNIILVSGREDKDRDATIRFLDKYNVPYNALYMRKTDDNRKDCVIKKEIYEQYIKPYYNVLLWLDDRNQVVSMVREELKIPCWQVNAGNF